jgi:hypothetical protein
MRGLARGFRDQHLHGCRRALIKSLKGGGIRNEEDYALSTDLRAPLAALAVFSLVGSLSLAVVAKAQAVDPVFAAFNDTCVAADADPNAVSGAANTHGWTPTNASGQTLPGFTLGDKVSKSKKIGDDEITLFSWKGAKGSIFANECQIHATRADFAGLQSAVAKMLGFAAAQTAPTKVVFHYTGPANAPKALADNSQFDAAAGAGGLYILTLSSDGKGANADLLKIHK